MIWDLSIDQGQHHGTCALAVGVAFRVDAGPTSADPPTPVGSTPDPANTPVHTCYSRQTLYFYLRVTLPIPSVTLTVILPSRTLSHGLPVQLHRNDTGVAFPLLRQTPNLWHVVTFRDVPVGSTFCHPVFGLQGHHQRLSMRWGVGEAL